MCTAIYLQRAREPPSRALRLGHFFFKDIFQNSLWRGQDQEVILQLQTYHVRYILSVNTVGFWGLYSLQNTEQYLFWNIWELTRKDISQ